MAQKPEELKKDDRLHGGIAVGTLTKYRNAIEASEAKMEKIRGDMSADWKAFEEAGGHKSAFKAAKKVAAMSYDEARDWIKAFNSYLEGLGTFHQLDLFYTETEFEKVELKKPEDQSKPKGQGLAEAVLAHAAKTEQSAAVN